MSVMNDDQATINLGDDVLKRGHHFYEDGNVLLVVGDTAFCVYKGLLSSHSQIMSDMFQVASSNQYQTRMLLGGAQIPVIQLQDGPLEFTDFLDLMLSRGKTPLQPAEISLHRSTCILRLASKYIAEDIASRMSEAIEPRLPTSTLDLEKLAVYSTPLEALTVIRASDILFQPARLTPLAYYALATVTWDQEQWNTVALSSDEERRRAMGREHILMSFARNALTLLKGACCDDCSRHNPTKWFRDRENVWTELSTHPLETIQGLLADFSTSTLCGASVSPTAWQCAGALKKNLEDVRKSILDSLVEYFELS